MAFAITQTCCNDATCVSVCPVNCIHPTPDEPDFGRTEMLYVDPRTCIDCGACADACPADAIFPVDRLMGPDIAYAGINRDYYDTHEGGNAWGEPSFPRSLPAGDPLRIAVVGTGPAASYTAQSLLRTTEAEVTMLDRMPVPGGLLRFGVAPDHPSTKKVGDSFAALFRHPRLTLRLNVEIGEHVTAEEVAAHHHAVVYAVGAAHDRTLGIDGEDLEGSISATRFVGWYNAHPDVPADAIDLSAERAVVVGNGNVALDVARILLSDPDRLAGTDIADHALAALRRSAVREVVLLARRGPVEAAYTGPELRALRHVPGVRLVVADDPRVRETIDTAEPGDKAALLRGVDVEEIDWRRPAPGERRIVLRFHAAPTELHGERGRVSAVGTTGGSTGEGERIPAGLVLRAIGYRSVGVPGLPFEPDSATVPHRAGRVTDVDGTPIPGVYVAGWVKRGPSGGIGANRECSAETVDSLLDDATAGLLGEPSGTKDDFVALIRARRPDAVGRKEMFTIDRVERKRGAESGRPRVKFATMSGLVAAGRRFGGR